MQNLRWGVNKIRSSSNNLSRRRQPPSVLELKHSDLKICNENVALAHSLHGASRTTTKARRASPSRRSISRDVSGPLDSLLGAVHSLSASPRALRPKRPARRAKLPYKARMSGQAGPRCPLGSLPRRHFAAVRILGAFEVDVPFRKPQRGMYNSTVQRGLFLPSLSAPTQPPRLLLALHTTDSTQHTAGARTAFSCRSMVFYSTFLSGPLLAASVRRATSAFHIRSLRPRMCK